jgi:hypothetical protein
MRAGPSIVITFSDGLPSVERGDRTVIDIEVIGNMLGFGLPASMDMIPGVNSSGKSPLTDGVSMNDSHNFVRIETYSG